MSNIFILPNEGVVVEVVNEISCALVQLLFSYYIMYIDHKVPPLKFAHVRQIYKV